MIQHRNTPRDIVFDMEDDIGDLRRLGSTLLLMATADGLEDVVRDGLHHAGSGISKCHRDLHDRWHRLFEQVVQAPDDEPEPATPVRKAPETTFDTLYAEWREAQEDGPQEALDETEAKVVHQLLTEPARSVDHVLKKMEIVESVMESRWDDDRDAKLLQSARRDLERLTGSPPAP